MEVDQSALVHYFTKRNIFYRMDNRETPMVDVIWKHFIRQIQIAPDMELRLQIGLSRHCSIGYLEESLSHFYGISAIQDKRVVRFLADHHIRLNITPSSNILLGRVSGMLGHPIGRLYRSGVDVTINSDDVLIFDSDVSKEYLRLFESGCLAAEELDSIRQNGLAAR